MSRMLGMCELKLCSSQTEPLFKEAASMLNLAMKEISNFFFFAKVDQFFCLNLIAGKIIAI